MKVSELIERLKKIQRIQGDPEVMVLDSFNGGGTPRTLNVGPQLRSITQTNADECGDCEDRVGERVTVIGFGSY
jgi:hypothetical protein